MINLRLIVSIALALSLTGCVGAVVGVAVDTTTAVVKAPFQIAGAVVGVAADTTGTVIAAPFRMANAAVGGSHHSDRDRHHEHHRSDERGADYEYVYPGDEHRHGGEP